MRRVDLRWLPCMCLATSIVATPLHAATITIVNADGAGEGFNDSTPVSPVGGNPGTTVGAQRLYVFQYAASFWETMLESPVEIRIQAKFDPMLCTSTSAVLGSSGPTAVFRDFNSAPLGAHWYHVALANSLSGIDLFAGDDISMTFNSGIGGAACLPAGWYYGVDGNEGGKVELLPVVLHEMAHGLGFSTTTNGSTGGYASGYPSVFDHFLFDDASGLHWDQMTAAQRAASAISCQSLTWDGPSVGQHAPLRLADKPLLRVNAPATIAGDYAVGLASFGPTVGSPGVTGNVVLADDGVGTVTNACEPLINGGAVNGNIALVDRGGGCGFLTKVRNAQNAGAIAVIVADSVPGCPPGSMGGSDPTITIPTVRITQSDGNLLKSHLAGLNATLLRDPALDNGADGAGRVMLYTPSTYSGGSSVSHWDTSAEPDLLMEPSLTPAMSSDIDLTPWLFADIGWNDGTTPTLLSTFEATTIEGAIEIRWQLADASSYASVVLERADALAGPWAPLTIEPHERDGMTVVLDRSVDPGRTYHYRLTATGWDSSMSTLGELSQVSGAAGAFEVSMVAPNPSRGAVRIDYTLPRRARVRLTVVDIAGRERAVLADQVAPAGHSQVTWSGWTPKGPAPAGLYFVRCQSLGKTLTRSVVRIP